MASAYGILDVTKMNKAITYDLTTTSEAGTRLYSDDWIEDQISDMERLVFGDIKTTYTVDTITNDVLFCIKKLSKITIENQLIKDENLVGDHIDEAVYWKEYLKPTLQAREEEKAFEDIQTIDDYVFN